jgi:hypothetical protein
MHLKFKTFGYPVEPKRTGAFNKNQFVPDIINYTGFEKFFSRSEKIFFIYIELSGFGRNIVAYTYQFGYAPVFLQVEPPFDKVH